MQLELHNASWGGAFSGDEGPSDTTWTVHTEVFDGPLDLLLYLVRRDGIDLLHLPVRRIADSYLAYLDRLRALNLSVAADYLVMAATLVHLKSLELLPRAPTAVDEEEVDPREALAAKLRAHAKLAKLAEAVEARPQVDVDVFVREPLDVDGDERGLTAPGDAFALLDLYYSLLTQRDAPPAQVELSHDGPDLGGCCLRLLQALGPGGRGELGAMLRSLSSKAERVVTFLATLEMTRLGWLILVQTGHLAPVHITRVVADEDIDISYIVGFEEPVEDQMVLPLSTT